MREDGLTKMFEKDCRTRLCGNFDPEEMGGTGFGPMGIGIVVEAGRTLADSHIY